MATEKKVPKVPSEWTEWGECSHWCGSGTEMRHKSGQNGQIESLWSHIYVTIVSTYALEENGRFQTLYPKRKILDSHKNGKKFEIVDHFALLARKFSDIFLSISPPTQSVGGL